MKNRFLPVRNFRISASLIPSNSSSSANFQENPAESQSPEPAEYSIKLSFAEAKASKEFINSNPTISELDVVNEDGVNKEVSLAVKLDLQKAREYKKSKGDVGCQGTGSENVDKIPLVESDGRDQRNDGLTSDEVKDVGGDKDVPLAVKLVLEKAAEYKKNKGVLGSNSKGTGGSETLDSGLRGGNVQSPGYSKLTKNSNKKGELSISIIDFMGLGFADKKSGRGLPAGLVPISDPFLKEIFHKWRYSSGIRASLMMQLM